jgi:hypothetical protein
MYLTSHSNYNHCLQGALPRKNRLGETWVIITKYAHINWTFPKLGHQGKKSLLRKPGWQLDSGTSVLNDILPTFWIIRQCKQCTDLMKQKAAFTVIAKLHGAWFYTLICCALFCHVNILSNIISFFKIHLFICAYIVWAISPLYLPPPPPSPTSLAFRQNLFCPFLQFCWREDISNNKKDIEFLLVLDKDSYTERFLALLPCTCVLQLELIHLYLTSSVLPGHLPIRTSVSLRLLY